MRLPPHVFRPKSPTRYQLKRQRLLDRFHQSSYAKVVQFNAAAGYGKSWTVTDITHHLPHPFAWYPLEFLNHPTTADVLWNLAWSIQHVFPTFSTLINQLSQEQLTPDTHNVLLPALSEGLSGLSEPFLIVLENYHTIYTSEIHESLIYLIERVPDNVRFIITSRTLQKWPVRWIADEQLVTFTETDLAFTHEEGIELAERIGVHLNREEVTRIFDHIGGWPILHALLYISMQAVQGKEIINVLHTLSMPNSAIYDYLAGELLHKAEPWAQEILCKTAMLQQIDGEICEALLDIQNGDAVLDQLTNGVFLTRQSSGSKHSYTHTHEITRTFLLHELERIYGPNETARLFHRVGALMEAKHMLDQAITAYCQGHHFVEAARVVQTHGMRLVSSIDLQRLQNWLDHFPQSWIDQDAHLLVYQGIIWIETKRDLADIPLYRARELFKAQNDVANRSWVEGELAWLLLFQGKVQEAATTIEPALHESALPMDIKARLYHVMTMVQNGKDDFAQSLHYAEQAAELYRALRTIEGKMALSRLLRHLSSIYIFQGRFREALEAIREARNLATALNQGNLPLAWINNQMATVYQPLAQFAEARDCLNEAERLLTVYPIQSRLQEFIKVNRGHIYREMYDYDLAEACYREAQRGNPNGVFMALRLVQPGATQEALTLARQKWNTSRDSESPIDKARYDSVLGIACLTAHEDKEAHHFLEAAERVFEQYGAWFHLATVRLYLAKLSLQAAKTTACGHIHLHYTLSHMKHNSYYGLDVWQPWVVADLCAYALEHNIEADFTVDLAIKRLNKTFAAPFVQLLLSSDDRVRSQATRILEHMDVIRLHAYQLLESCKEPTIRSRVANYLQAGWLTETGIIRLKSDFTWREIDILLLWIAPHIRGRIDEIAEIACISTQTVKSYLNKTIRTKLEDVLSQDLSGKGNDVLVFEWTISTGIIDPTKTNPMR